MRIGIQEFKVQARSKEGGGDEVKQVFGKEDLITLECNEKVTSQFATEYIKKMVGIAGADTNLLLELSSDYPIKIGFELLDSNMKIQYILAPRVE